MESEDSLSYTNYLKRAKEKQKENIISLKKQKRNSLEEFSRNINNIKTIEKKESFTHDNNNATTNNGNVVNILNGTNDKNVEINFNKYEIKILPDKINDKIIHPRTHSSYTRSNVDTIINKIKEESERKIKLKINQTVTKETKPFNTIPTKQPSSINNDSECSNNNNNPNDFFLIGKGKQSKMLTFLDKLKESKLYLKTENQKTRNHSIQLKMDQFLTISNEISITCPNERMKIEPEKKHYIACTETNLFYSGINTDTNIIKEDDITLKDHFSVNSHFTYQKNLLKKQSSKKTSTFATEAENNYLSAGGMNETESNIILVNKNKKIQKMLTDKVQRNLRITSKMKSKSMSEHKDFLEKSFDDISSIQPSPKDDAPIKDNTEKSHSSIFKDGSFNHSIESNCFISDENEKEKLKLTQNDFPQLIHKKKSNKKLSIRRASTISKKSKDVNPSFKFLVRDEKKKLSKEITALKLNLTISPNKKTAKNKKFLRQLSRISEISNMNQRNSKNNINSTISLIKQKVTHNNNSCEFIRRKDESFESISLTKENIKRAKSSCIEITFREYGERILTKIQKISKVIQEENGSSSLSSKVESNSSMSSFKSRGYVKRIQSDAFSKNQSRRTSLNFFELRSNSISLTKKALQYNKEPLSEKSLNFLRKLDEDISDKVLLMTDNSAEEKDSILTKLLLILDIKCNKLDEKRKRTYRFATTRALNNFNIDLETAIQYSNSINDNNSASDEYIFQQMILNNNNIRLSDYSLQIIPLLIDTYFDIKLYDQIFKVGYLDGDIEEVPNVADINTLFLHFTYKKNSILRQKTRRASKQCNHYSKKNFLVKQYIFDGPNNVKFINSFFRADIVYKEYTFDSTPQVFRKPTTLMKKTYAGSVSLNKKKTTTTNLSGLLSKKTSKFYSKKTTVRCSNTLHVYEQQNSIASMNSLNNMYSQKNEPRVLNRDFFERERDVEGNLNYEELNNRMLSHENLLRKQRQQLFISPLKRASSELSDYPNKRLSINQSNRTAFDKESMMYKTHEIKSEMLKGCNSVKESLFFYIKDSNYQTFVELFSKFKLDTEERDKEGNTFINLAVQCDCEDIVNYLISKGANVNTQNNKLNSPLHYALSYQNFTIGDLLLRSGADEKLKNAKGLTPWQCLDTKHSIV